MDAIAIPPADGALRTGPVERDALFWTELEIRRLGNLVAAALHAKHYVGDSDKAHKERARVRTLLDAMRRKSLRVLHRAEINSREPDTPWKGLDPAINDPVALAEEYVRVVEKYEAMFGDEESRTRRAANGVRMQSQSDAAATTTTTTTTDPFLPGSEEWEREDDKLYREAVAEARAAAKNGEDARRDLLGEDETGGLRRRRNGTVTAKLSQEDELLMKRHQPVQDQLSADLVDIVGRLKGSVSGINEKIVKDNAVIDDTEDVVDKNLVGIERQRDDLTSFSNSTTTSWWMLIVLTVVVLIVFIFVFLLLKVPI